jgi:xylose dehydrogenase (NAD/NADP)
LAQPDNPRLAPQQGGGALLDVGSYGVSTAHWMLGSEPLQVQATAIYHTSGADLLFAGTLLFAGDAVATVAAGFIGALEQTYRVSGELGAIETPHDAYIPGEKDTHLILRGADQPTGRQMAVQGVDQYRLMIEHFADAAVGRCQPLVPIRESVANMRVLDALAQAARSGHSITLKNDDPT